MTEASVWYPENPPALPGEDPVAYAARLTGTDGAGLIPYDHARHRYCAVGQHSACPDRHLYQEPEQRDCQCPCHDEEGELSWLLGCVVNTLRSHQKTFISVSYCNGWMVTIARDGQAFTHEGVTPYRALEACANEAFRTTSPEEAHRPMLEIVTTETP